MPKLTFSHTGATFDVPEGASFLEFCQENDAPQDFGCTVGSCGTCSIVIEEGMDTLPELSEDERETVEMCTDEGNARLGCQITVRGDLKVRPAST